MKRKYICIFSTIIMVGLSIFVYLNNKNGVLKTSQSISIYRQQAENYLNDKYFESIVVTNEWSYLEGETIVSFNAFSEGYPNYKFKVLCITKELSFSDYYLPVYLAIEMDKLIQKSLENYFIDGNCFTSTELYPASYKIKSLQNYYEKNRNYLSLYDYEDLVLPDIFDCVTITLYEDIEQIISEEKMLLLIEDIKDIGNSLGINIKKINLVIYENKEELHVKNNITFKLIDREYIKQ